MNVVKVTPQGYCFGVVNAIAIAKKAIATQPKPIYILGDIVHNKLVTKSLADLGLITIEVTDLSRLDLLDKIEHGTVIFTAHGVSPQVRKKALAKGLNIVDATCPEVMNTQQEITKYLQMGYKIIFVGKKNHPEAEACINIDKANTIFITSLDDLAKTKFSNEKYFISYQSTLNTEFVSAIAPALETALQDYIFTNTKSVCKATKSRQEAVKNLTDVDLLIVVGDEKSNNTNQLVEISMQKAHIKAVRVNSIADLDFELLKDVETVAVTSGASTPTSLTNMIIDFLKQFDYYDKNTHKYILEDNINI